MDVEKCLICGKPSIKINNSENGICCSCSECGTYILGDYITALLRDGNSSGIGNIQTEDIPKLRSCLFYYLRVILNNHNQNRFTPFITASQNSGAEHEIDVHTVLNLYPDDIAKRLDMVLQLLGTTIQDVDDGFRESISGWDCFYFLPSKDDPHRTNQAYAIIRLLMDLQYIRKETTNYTFTTKGWERLDYLNKNRIQSNTAFIAMSFSENKVITDAEATIKAAIARAHYIPMIIKEKEHNNYIMPEIIHEIKKSKFIIADLTELKAGVYYEAGYAKALEKEVIFTCNERDFEQRHFDIAQVNTIKWSNKPEEQLKIFEEQLYSRIISTVGKNI